MIQSLCIVLVWKNVFLLIVGEPSYIICLVTGYCGVLGDWYWCCLEYRPWLNGLELLIGYFVCITLSRKLLSFEFVTVFGSKDFESWQF